MGAGWGWGGTRARGEWGALLSTKPRHDQQRHQRHQNARAPYNAQHEPQLIDRLHRGGLIDRLHRGGLMGEKRRKGREEERVRRGIAPVRVPDLDAALVHSANLRGFNASYGEVARHLHRKRIGCARLARLALHSVVEWPVER